MSIDIIILETISVSVLNVTAIILATYVFKLGWHGILIVMLFASLFTAWIVTIIVSKAGSNILNSPNSEQLDISLTNILNLTDAITHKITDGNRVLIISGLSSLAVLLILTHRFNFPTALGIALLSGIETMWWREFLFK
jgi:hypothetical protein